MAGCVVAVSRDLFGCITDGLVIRLLGFSELRELIGWRDDMTVVTPQVDEVLELLTKEGEEYIICG